MLMVCYLWEQNQCFKGDIASFPLPICIVVVFIFMSLTLSSCKSMAFTATFSRYATVSLHRRRRIAGVVGVGKEDTEVRVDAVEDLSMNTQLEQADPQDLEYVPQIQRLRL
ncbi:hypothetical protein SLEP1_g52772 [Rubroshorea leprosula]|uniref:Uncharacterized protein n=1 Tax=Rubroshorea leprosula TaxID=152421 RepID=A0AAV5MA10_9ROSI|nr:hypothetical protein SLEP1_g52772 [Rubroshorea leprosula]